MKEKLRKSGINIIGDVPWGTHFCQFYQTKEDLIDILVPYFKAGLENNEYCMWITSEPLMVKEAKEALKKKVKNLNYYIKKGQMEILDYSEWYVNYKEKLNLDEVLKNWVKKEKHAIKKGFDGIRVTGNTYWLEKRDWKKFTEYEAVVDSVIGKYKMIAICSYCLDKCGASDIIDVVSNHEFALIRKEGKWEIIESTERKKVEEELRENEEQYKNTIENIIKFIPEGLLVFTNKLNLFMKNKSIQDLVSNYAKKLNYSEEELMEIIVEQAKSRIISGDNSEIRIARKKG